MAGKPWQPSHEPPPSKGNRHPSHCKHSGKEGGKGVGGELPGRWAATLWNARERLLYIRHVTLCYNPQARGIRTPHMLTPLTSRGTQALFVVNSVKLHLTALNKSRLIIFLILLTCLLYTALTLLGEILQWSAHKTHLRLTRNLRLSRHLLPSSAPNMHRESLRLIRPSTHLHTF